VPALTVTWSAGEVEEGAGALLQGTPPAGSLPSDLPIPVRLTSGGQSRIVTMAWDGKREAWIGKGADLPIGKWSVGTPPEASIEILPGSIASLAVIAPPSGFADRFPWLPILLAAILLAATAMFLLMRRRRRFQDVDGEYDEPSAYGAATAGAGANLFANDDDLDDEILLDDEGMDDYVADVERRQEESTHVAADASDDDEEEILDLETIILDD
jgi:hypothetical protein